MRALRVLISALRRLFIRSASSDDSPQTLVEKPRPRRSSMTAEEFETWRRARLRRKRERGDDQPTLKE